MSPPMYNPNCKLPCLLNVYGRHRWIFIVSLLIFQLNQGIFLVALSSIMSLLSLPCLWLWEASTTTTIYLSCDNAIREDIEWPNKMHTHFLINEHAWSGSGWRKLTILRFIQKTSWVIRVMSGQMHNRSN